MQQTMKTEKTEIEARKQRQLTQDYADFLAEYEASKGKGVFIGTFIAWRHANNRDGIKIDDSRKR